MVYPGMVGITELMTDDSFLSWVESQDVSSIESLSNFEIYDLYQKAH